MDVYVVEEHELVEAARAGDESAFRRLVEPYRGELYAHCLRMLASSHDAEDAMQEMMLRSWRALATYQGRASLRSWLYRIATNACLDVIARRPKQVVPPEVSVELAGRHEEHYEHRETAMVAFEVALDRLPPRQRAVLILREVLGFSARETASSLETTIPAVNSALQRARANLDQGVDLERARRSSRSQGFVDALRRGDIEVLVGLAAQAPR